MKIISFIIGLILYGVPLFVFGAFVLVAILGG